MLRFHRTQLTTTRTTQRVLESIVDKFTWTRPSSWSVPDFPDVDRETMQERLHSGLDYLLQLFPAARPALCRVVGHMFPYPETSKVHQPRLSSVGVA